MSPSTRRLQKEANELLTTQASPSIHAAPVSDNLFDWHFTIAGPPSPSPYSEGLYHGRIVLPPSYPLRPPSFRFLTPTGRFEVNREICLSISGHHEESWQPAWGIRTALLAIRSFMDAEANGQVGGLDVSEAGRREYARLSRGWVCEACGESNERVMEGWRGECRELGRDDDGDDDGDAEEGEKRKDQDESLSSQEGGAHTAEQPPTSTTSTTTTVPPEPPRHATAPVSSTSAPQERPVAVANPRVQEQSDGPWLDRAIIGVLLALVFMLLRRFVNIDD